MADEMIQLLKQSWKYNDAIDNKENIYLYAETRLRKAIHDTKEELYILNKFPFVYYNQRSAHIGGEFNYRYENEILIYEIVIDASWDIVFWLAFYFCSFLDSKWKNHVVKCR